MRVKTTELRCSTQGDGDAIDITAEVQHAVDEAGMGTARSGRPGHGLREWLDRGDHDDGVRAGRRLNHDSNSHATNAPRLSARH